MATDNSPPKVALIVKIGVLAVAVLILIRLGLVSYFHSVADEERHLKYIEMAQSRGLSDLRNDEAKRLSNVQSSMDTLAAKGRMEPGIMPSAASPESAKDTLAGWMQMPKPVDSAAMMPAPSSAPAPSSSAPAGDGGAAPAASASASAAPSASAPAPAPSASAPHAHPQGSASAHP